MSDSFVKLYASILDSSLWWGEDVATRLVWVTLLVAADHNGVYSGTLPGLAGKARVTLEEARHAVWRLQQPDDESRTPDHDGRRIEHLPGVGYQLLNYQKYRDRRSPRQIADAARKAAGRVRTHADMSECPPQILDLRSEILDPRSEILDREGSPEGSAPAAPPPAGKPAPKRPKGKPRSVKVLLPDDFEPTAQHATIARECGKDLGREFSKMRDWAAANGVRRADWGAALRLWLQRDETRHGAARGHSGPRSRNSDVFEHIFRKATEGE